MTTITLDDAEINAALKNLVRHINNLLWTALARPWWLGQRLK